MTQYLSIGMNIITMWYMAHLIPKNDARFLSLLQQQMTQHFGPLWQPMQQKPLAKWIINFTRGLLAIIPFGILLWTTYLFYWGIFNYQPHLILLSLIGFIIAILNMGDDDEHKSNQRGSKS